MLALGGAGVGRRSMLLNLIRLCIYKSRSKCFALDQMMLCTVSISNVPIMIDIRKLLKWLR